MEILQHDSAIAMTEVIMNVIREDLNYHRRLSMVYVLYRAIRAGLEKYEQLRNAGPDYAGCQSAVVEGLPSKSEPAIPQ